MRPYLPLGVHGVLCRSHLAPVSTRLGHAEPVGLVVFGVLLLLYRAGSEVAYQTRPSLHRPSTRWFNHAGLGLFGLAMILAGAGASVAAGAMVLAAGLTGVFAIIRAAATRS
jgi:hypothetical protein